jgi:hypothetical protein
MAVLTDNARAGVWADLMRRYSSDGETIGVSKADLRTAVNDVDTWLNSNAAALNSAISQPARGALTTAQKALILTYVTQKRYLDGSGG